jgi:phosphorylcholine metabolism protein LicD
MLIPVLICIFLIIFLYMKRDYKLSNQNVELSPNLSPIHIENLKKSQQKMLGMMKTFHNICVKYNIKYMLGYGNLLGSILYQGWIPWDGDVDIMVAEEDFEKLKNVLLHELPLDLWFQDSNNDKTYQSRVISKIRDLNSCYSGYSHKNKKSHNGLQIDLTTYKFINNRLVTYDKNDLRNIMFNDTYPLKLSKYEDGEFYIPNNAEKFLTQQYGNKWKKIPPVYSRYPHEGLMDPENACPHHQIIYPTLKHHD